jgi:uncharacterized phage protein (TIGR02220 family)
MSKEFDDWFDEVGAGILEWPAEEAIKLAWNAALASLEQKLTKPKTKLTKRSKDVLEYFKAETGKPFRTRDLIEHRLNEGFTTEELKMVIDYAITNWSGTRFADKIVPNTLFRSNVQTSKYLDLALGEEPMAAPIVLTRPPQKPMFEDN